MNKLQRAFSFVGRQIYKLVIVVPFELGALLYGACLRSSPTHGSTTYCVITSVIECQPTRLTYAATRSVFSAQQRLEQTVLTVASVRAQIPGAHIVLVEGGAPSVISAELKSLVDTYIDVHSTGWVRSAVNSRFKSLGEVCMLLGAQRRIPRDGNLYFKISGRYQLEKNFSIAAWSGRMFNFYFIRPNFVSTRLYSFSGEYFHRWHRALVRSLPYLFLDYPIEFLLYRFVPKQLQVPIKQVGISGCDATNGARVIE